MMEDSAREIQRLRAALEKKKEEIQDLRRLVNKEIDRDFPPDLDAFSEKELDTFIRELILSGKDFTESKPDLKPIKSHRKSIGKPIVLLKRMLLETTFDNLDLFLDKQVRFNRQSADLGRALFLRLRIEKERLEKVEERIIACEESLVILKSKLEDLSAGLEEMKGRRGGHL
jgi:hypothetical protein